MAAATGFQPDTRLIKRFVNWIERFDIQHARNWAKLYRANPEAAMCEATFWGVLTDCGVSVEPNAALASSTAAPDFVCTKDGQKFYVEATCLRIDTVSRKTALSPERSTGHYGLLTAAICDECRNKTPQCADLDAPCLVAIGTFHHPASVLCIERRNLEDVLLGTTGFGLNINVDQGKAVGDPYQVTTLKSASFIRPGTQSDLGYRRHPISGLLLGGFSVSPPSLYGLLNPAAVREFDTRLLSRIPFGRLNVDTQGGSMSVEWTDQREERADG